MLKTDWNPILREEFAKPYWQQLQAFVAAERASGTVYPPATEVFAAFELTSFADVRVVVLGQDPYHGPGQAHGLAFSVRPQVKPPPSLRNIFTELESDLGFPPPQSGSLTRWARQGVLLLNTTLTVAAGQAASHQKQGWETFTDQVIGSINDRPEPVVFLLWGSAARAKKKMIDPARHTIIESPHPSPLSAHRGFFGSRPFSAANDALIRHGHSTIDWSLSPEAELKPSCTG